MRSRVALFKAEQQRAAAAAGQQQRQPTQSIAATSDGEDDFPEVISCDRTCVCAIAEGSCNVHLNPGPAIGFECKSQNCCARHLNAASAAAHSCMNPLGVHLIHSLLMCCTTGAVGGAAGRSGGAEPHGSRRGGSGGGPPGFRRGHRRRRQPARHGAMRLQTRMQQWDRCRRCCSVSILN